MAVNTVIEDCPECALSLACSSVWPAYNNKHFGNYIITRLKQLRCVDCLTYYLEIDLTMSVGLGYCTETKQVELGKYTHMCCLPAYPRTCEECYDKKD